MIPSVRAAHTQRDFRVVAVRLVMGGQIQGVGFRPFVYRQACRLGICGSIANQRGTVEILAQGDANDIEVFVNTLLTAAPPLARPVLLSQETALTGYIAGFSINDSTFGDDTDIHLPPDYFVCDDCLSELRDPANRRYRYPFINCTQCGPRYTLVRRLPYDRRNTSMAGFNLCDECLREYSDPLDRRFHAEPIACPACGPQLHYHDTETDRYGAEPALAATLAKLRNGGIIAVKGIGGYHLICDARNNAAVTTLRMRKHRPDKPLAVMIPLRGDEGLEQARDVVTLDTIQARLLLDPMRPIVLATKATHCQLAPGIAPGLNEIGVMLPYSPLHYLLTDAFNTPLVATSANISGEPVLSDNDDVEMRLAGIADAFVHHNRAIVRPADDPVYRVIVGKPRPLRLGRGNAPLELELPMQLDQPVLAVGGHIKNSVALAWDNRMVISPHIGELTALRSQRVFEQVIEDLQQLYGVEAEIIAHDAHPGYSSTRWARQSRKPLVSVLHHYAHASAVAGEFSDETNWLVFTWDGTGYGGDGTLWGGEALLGHPGCWRRVASMRHFRLPGGEQAIREPWRTAASLCWETGIPWNSAPLQAIALHKVWSSRLDCPASSAVGRLFDAAAALTELLHNASFSGQGPMLLEAAAGNTDATPIVLDCIPDESGVLRTDWAPLVPMLLDTNLSIAQRAACFHTSLAHALRDQARQIRNCHGDFAIGLGGGVFQNRLLTAQIIALLDIDGFRVYLPEKIPVNDGGLSFGQIIEVAGNINA